MGTVTGRCPVTAAPTLAPAADKKLVRPPAEMGCWSQKMKEYSNSLVVARTPDGALRIVKQSVLNGQSSAGIEGYACRNYDWERPAPESSVRN